jgi:hypothetical protein
MSSSKYTVKGVKCWQGTDGMGFECSLYREGKKVARCLEDGGGGEIHIYWEDRQAPFVPIKVMVADYSDAAIREDSVSEKQHTYKGTPEEKLLVEMVNAMTTEFHGSTLRKDAGWYIGDLCEEFDNQRRLKARLRKATWFRLKSETYNEDEWSVVRAPWSQRVKDHLVNKYGDNLGEVLNETLGIKMK